jgi:hypothetical protein
MDEKRKRERTNVDKNGNYALFINAGLAKGTAI